MAWVHTKCSKPMRDNWRCKEDILLYGSQEHPSGNVRSHCNTYSTALRDCTDAVLAKALTWSRKSTDDQSKGAGKK